jgi:hypothetical protein
MFTICSRVSSDESKPHEILNSPQEQTGKGALLRVARVGIGRPVKAPAFFHMKTGEGRAKVLRGVGLKAAFGGPAA